MGSKRTISILVVDDLESWRDLLSAILEGDGHQVVTASTFQEAKTLLEIEQFDVVILDMRLVDDSVYNIQGMALLEEAKRLTPSTKAIILTGYPDPDHRAKALDFYKADGYFEKAPNGQPLDIEKFSQLILDLSMRVYKYPGGENV